MSKSNETSHGKRLVTMSDVFPLGELTNEVITDVEAVASDNEYIVFTVTLSNGMTFEGTAKPKHLEDAGVDTNELLINGKPI